MQPRCFTSRKCSHLLGILRLFCGAVLVALAAAFFAVAYGMLLFGWCFVIECQLLFAMAGRSLRSELGSGLLCNLFAESAENQIVTEALLDKKACTRV